MHKFCPDINENEDDDESKSHEQFPVDTDVVREVRLEATDTGVDFVRIVVMNDKSTPRCSAYHEYYHGNADISIDGFTSFTLRSSTIAGTQQVIDEFVGTMSLHLEIPQSASWRLGIYSPSAARKRLYKATDPDDSTKMIGLLLEQDSQGRLVRITWYKTRNAGVIFRSTPEMLSFELVKGEDSMPSLDPNDIGGWTWYYTTNLGNSLSSRGVSLRSTS